MTLSKRLAKIEAVILPKRDEEATRIEKRVMIFSISALPFADVQILATARSGKLLPEHIPAWNHLQQKQEEVRADPDTHNLNIPDKELREKWRNKDRRR